MDQGLIGQIVWGNRRELLRSSGVLIGRGLTNGRAPGAHPVRTKEPRAAAPPSSSAVKKEIGTGPTVLFPDGGGSRQQTVDAVDQVLARLKDQGAPPWFPRPYRP